VLSNPDFLAGVRQKGDYLREKLEALQARYPLIEEVRGLGLMWGLQLDREGTPVVTACRERGLLVNCTQGNVIRLLPPLVVEKADMDRCLEILAQALETLGS
jgi:acetylornithine/succinyldiaminopimelate/putrescine aminotransferase